MDLNQSIDFNTSSSQVHNFMSMSSNFMSPYDEASKENCEEVWHSRLVHVQKQALEIFWNQQLFAIQNTSEFKSHHQLPLARIKRIMKTDEEVKMISADTPTLFAKAIELFILELTLRSWLQAEECKRRTLHRCDIATAIKHEDLFDFLVDLVPHHHCQEDDHSENCCEEIEPLSGIEVPFPMIDINQDFIMPNQGTPQQFMMRPPIPSAEFNYESQFKWTK